MKLLKTTGGIFLLVALLVVTVSCQQTKTPPLEKKETPVTTEKQTDANWTNSSVRGSISDSAIAGKLNDEAIKIAYTKITKWDNEFRWTFSNVASSDVCGIILDDNAINFDSKILKEGTFTKKMEDVVAFDDYYAYYHYEETDGSPMSINGGWASTVVVKEINKDTKKVIGWAKFDFEDKKTSVEGSFTADYCED